MPTTNNLKRDTLQKIRSSTKYSSKQKELAALRVAYSEDHKLLTDYVNKMIHVNRIHPRLLPTQASGRTSTIDPPLTNWPRQCINPICQSSRKDNNLADFAIDNLGYIEHEWTDECWSIRDIITCDEDEILVSWDHDNIEGKIHDLIVDDKEAITAHEQMFDLHTITCCNIFGYLLPTDLRNPHSSEVDAKWRSDYNWQGKDTKQRVLAKNFNHGSKYTESYKFVHKIQGIEKYGISYRDLEQLARNYIESKKHAWHKKLAIMARIRREKVSRTLYGFKRKFYTSDPESGRQGFSHMISGTVSHYNNDTIITVDNWIGDNCRLLHNAHDGDKFAVKKLWLNFHYDGLPEEKISKFKKDIQKIIERPIEYESKSLIMTAGIKIYA